MASGSSKEPKGSSEEAVSSPGPEVAAAAPGAGDDEAAAPAVSPPAPAATTRPYYECVFCKRGFTTAQALGGHMNIHRRDRAKPSHGDTHTPPSGMASVSRNDVECYNQYHNLAPYPPAPPATAPMSSSSSSLVLATYYRSTRAATGVVDGEASVSLSPGSASTRELSLFGAAARDHDLHLGLGCHGRGGNGSHASPERSERQAAAEPDRELDLELRLGRRPRN